MIEPILLILILLSGYAFSTTWYGSFYRAAREDGHRLYFRAAFYGCFSLICAFIITVLIFYSEVSFKLNLFIDWIQTISGNTYLFPSRFIATLIIVTLLFGLFAGHVMNAVSNFWEACGIHHNQWIGTLVPTKRFLLSQAMVGDELELLVQRSLRSKIPISIELKNGKLYVGFILQSFDPTQPSHGREISLFPMMSGHREEKGVKGYKFTYDYTVIYKEIAKHSSNSKHALFRRQEQDFIKIIPITEISCYCLFDIRLHRYFKEQETGGFGYNSGEAVKMDSELTYKKILSDSTKIN
ncbi:hypothetical protein [Zobellella denitrificans]